VVEDLRGELSQARDGVSSSLDGLDPSGTGERAEKRCRSHRAKDAEATAERRRTSQGGWNEAHWPAFKGFWQPRQDTPLD
jgi:hypothetical protein